MTCFFIVYLEVKMIKVSDNGKKFLTKNMKSRVRDWLNLTYMKNKSYIKNVEFLENFQKNTKNSKKTIKKMKKW